MIGNKVKKISAVMLMAPLLATVAFVAPAQAATSDVTEARWEKLQAQATEGSFGTAQVDTTLQALVVKAAATTNKGQKAADIAKNKAKEKGVQYKSGATGPNAFDCSGFALWVYKQVGYNLPRTAAEQYKKGTAVDQKNLKPGDLVFFKDTYKKGISHVGVYIGNGEFAHAANEEDDMEITPLSNSYWKKHYAGAKRYF
jgi:cell wall-associated NlpC family hydrolase